jgi:hypothetical protein
MIRAVVRLIRPKSSREKSTRGQFMKGLVLTALFIAPSAYGQTAAEVNTKLDAIRGHYPRLDVAVDNLKGMAIGLDANAVTLIRDAVVTFKMGTETVIAVGNLLPYMRNAEDARKVRVQLQYSLGVALQLDDVYLDVINGYMTQLKGAAALAETTKARDEMNAIRDLLRSLKT